MERGLRVNESGRLIAEARLCEHMQGRRGAGIGGHSRRSLLCPMWRGQPRGCYAGRRHVVFTQRQVDCVLGGSRARLRLWGPRAQPVTRYACGTTGRGVAHQNVTHAAQVALPMCSTQNRAAPCRVDGTLPLGLQDAHSSDWGIATCGAPPGSPRCGTTGRRQPWRRPSGQRGRAG